MMKKRGIILMLFFILLIFFSLLGLLYFNNLNNESFGEGFSIVVLPDTQLYAQDYPEIFSEQTQWVVDNKDELNIKFVVHVGDIVQSAVTEIEWKRANESMSILDGKVPYLVVPGNHDRHPVFNSYFPHERFEIYDWYLGYYKKEKEDGYGLDGNNENNYGYFSANGWEFLVIGLQFCPSDDVLEWANQIAGNNKDKEIIVFTHLYMSNDNNRISKKSSLDCGRYSYCNEKGSCNNGEEIWEEFIKNHKNIILVLSGHVHPPRGSRRIDCIDNSPVYQILQDYQDLENGGNGWLRYYTFKPKEKIIEVKTYSPHLNEFSLSSSDNFDLFYHPDNCVSDPVN